MCRTHETGMDEHGSCCVSGIGPMRGLIKAWLLLRLSDGPAHGYQLLEYLNRSDVMGHADAGLLYRTLRQFEHEGDVTSMWSTEGTGPARRVYEVTERGRAHLGECAQHVEVARERLGRFLEACAERQGTQVSGLEVGAPSSRAEDT
jgi:PadR family transcriptional regulator, regulatory protein PadR